MKKGTSLNTFSKSLVNSFGCILSPKLSPSNLIKVLFTLKEIKTISNKASLGVD